MRIVRAIVIACCLFGAAAGAEPVFKWDNSTQIEDGVIWIDIPSDVPADATAGIAWRVQDPDHCYLALYSGGDKIFALFAVTGGEPKLLRADTVKLKPGKNHFEVRYAGEIMTANLNKEQIMVVKDATITRAGGIGWMAENMGEMENPSVAEWEVETKKLSPVKKKIEWETDEDFEFEEEVSVEVITTYEEEWEVQEEHVMTEEVEVYESFESVEEYESYEEWEEEYEEEYEEEVEEEVEEEEMEEEEEEMEEEIEEEEEEIEEEEEEMEEEIEEEEEEIEEEEEEIEEEIEEE